MYPFQYGYEPVSSPQYMYRPSTYARADPYWQAVAEEEAARRQYEEALRQQAQARDRAARARYAQRAYESPYDSYLSGDDDQYDYSYAPHSTYGVHPYMSPREQRAMLDRQRLEEQQRRLAELERERERERMRLRQLEEERRRRALLEQQERERMRSRLQRSSDESDSYDSSSPTFDYMRLRPEGIDPRLVRMVGLAC